MEFLAWNPLTCFRLQILLTGYQSHRPKSVIVWDFPTSTDVIMIKLIPSLSSWGKQKYHPANWKQTSNKYKKQTKRQANKAKLNKLFPLHAFMGDTIRHNFAQMTSTSKTFIPCFLVIIINWCHMITWDKLQQQCGR